MKDYAILINTCDKFEDCWEPFFSLWKLYWPDCKAKIYLNTEYKEYSFEGLSIIPVQGCKRNKVPKNDRATWSQCLKWALDFIDSNVVLYMQEDYFLKDHVKNQVVEEYVQLMQKDKLIHCIHLTDQAVTTQGESDKYEGLFHVKLKQRYRLGCQAALWQKDVLNQHIRIHESAWEFEEFGSQRSSVLKHNFYCVDKNKVKINEFEIIPYIFTGIVQGRWFEEVIPLFEKHNIEINYEERGFLNSAKPKPFLNRIKYQLQKFPKIIKNHIYLYKLKSYNE